MRGWGCSRWRRRRGETVVGGEEGDVEELYGKCEGRRRAGKEMEGTREVK